MQLAVESFLIELFSNAWLCTTHSKRVTIQIRDLRLALRLRGLEHFYERRIEEALK